LRLRQIFQDSTDHRSLKLGIGQSSYFLWVGTSDLSLDSKFEMLVGIYIPERCILSGISRVSGKYSKIKRTPGHPNLEFDYFIIPTIAYTFQVTESSSLLFALISLHLY
jgi:hypothetical protein